MRVRIVGSTQFREQLTVVRTALEQRGHLVMSPRKDPKEPLARDELRKHVDSFREEIADTAALLLVHPSGFVPQFVLAELGVGAYLGKKLYVYGNIPPGHEQDFAALNIVSLGGALGKVF